MVGTELLILSMTTLSVHHRACSYIFKYNAHPKRAAQTHPFAANDVVVCLHFFNYLFHHSISNIINGHMLFLFIIIINYLYYVLSEVLCRHIYYTNNYNTITFLLLTTPTTIIIIIIIFYLLLFIIIYFSSSSSTTTKTTTEE